MRQLIYIFLLVFTVNIARSQDPNFTQFFNNHLYYNPGMTAINGGLHLSANYRNLWGPIPSKFNTSTFSADAEAINKIGLGVILLSDNEGEGRIKTNSASFSYSYRPLETRNIRVQLGASAGFVYKNIDYSYFVFSDQLDEVHGDIYGSQFVIPSQDNVMYPDFSAGAVVRFNNPNNRYKDYQAVTTVGFAMHHLTRPKDAFLGDQARLPRKLTLHANTHIQWEGIVYAPGVIYEKQANMTTFQIGTNIMKYPIFTGFWFRNRNAKFQGRNYDSFIFNLGAYTRLGDVRAKFTYSFDFTVSRLKTASMGSHEVSLVLNFDDVIIFKNMQKRANRKQSTRFLECVDYQ